MNTVPAERVAPLIRWMVRRYGVAGTADILETSRSHLRRIVKGEQRNVTQDFALRVVDVVGQHKLSADPFARTFEQDVTRRLPTSRDRDATTRQANRVLRDYYRRKARGEWVVRPEVLDP